MGLGQGLTPTEVSKRRTSCRSLHADPTKMEYATSLRDIWHKQMSISDNIKQQVGQLQGDTIAAEITRQRQLAT